MYGLTEKELLANKGKITEEQKASNYKQLKALNIELPFNLDNVDPECHACVLTQLDKYKKFVGGNGKTTGNKFSVPCDGIITNIFDDSLKAGFTEEEWESIKAQADIVMWAKKYLKLDKNPWVARWYQELVLRCTSRRKTLRISRRAGKCISERSTVLTENGPLSASKLIENKGLKIATIDQNTLTFSLTDKYNIWSNGIKDTYKLTTKSGRVNYVTGNHPFLTMSSSGLLDWKELDDLSTNEYIAVPNSYENLIKGKEIDLKEARLLGYLIGDGGTNDRNTMRFTNFNKKTIKDISNIVDSYGCKLTFTNNGNYRIVAKKKKMVPNNVAEIAKKHNICKLAIHKEVPSSIFEATEEAITNFLAAYWDCDGWCCVNKLNKGRKTSKTQVGCSSSSEKLARGIFHLLLRVGISSTIKERKVKYLDSFKMSWQINIDDVKNITKFANKIPLIGKKDDIQTVLSEVKNKTSVKNRKADCVPKEIYHYIDQKRIEKSLSKREIGLEKDSGYRVSYSDIYAPNKYKLSVFSKNLEDQYLSTLCKKDVNWDQIKDISYIGKEETYDLSVPDTHTLISDDIISHNTTLVCIEICYHLFRKKTRIVVAGPQKTHTEEIVNRVRDFINSNPELADCVVKDKQAPYYKMILSNGSELRGFAAGAKGKGGSGEAIRGQDSDMLYLEEMQYIAEDAITGAVFPVLQTHPDTYLVGFSTPNGLRTPFYSLCEQNPDVKEFHYTYKVLPHWKAVEADRLYFTEAKWEHEFLAGWGSSESGVYKPIYVDDASVDYNYSDYNPTPGWKYCIGTDWNEKHGTEIVVVGWNAFKSKFIVVETLHIEPSQFTQLDGVNKLLEVNKKWDPEFVYIDAGNGSTNYELLMTKALKSRGHDLVTAKLLKSLKKYDSGAAIETKDPVTKQKVRKPAKSFMVNASVRMFEQNRIFFSAEDTKLDAQLRNYVIERYTPNGNPVYGLAEEKVGDHKLDALNLALVAFHLEFDDLYQANNNVCTNVGAVPDPRTKKLQSFRNDTNVGKEQGPQDRRLEGRDGETFAQSLITNIPGKVDKTLVLKTNRLGWATDEEDKFKQQASQRKRGRARLSNSRPQRETF